MSPAAAERSLGDGGAAATRPEAPRAEKLGSPGTRRSPGTAGTPPSPPGELPLRVTTLTQRVAPTHGRPQSLPSQTSPQCCHHNHRGVVPGGPQCGPALPSLASPPLASLVVASFPSVRDSSSPLGLSQPSACLDVTPLSSAHPLPSPRLALPPYPPVTPCSPKQGPSARDPWYGSPAFPRRPLLGIPSSAASAPLVSPPSPVPLTSAVAHPRPG